MVNVHFHIYDDLPFLRRALEYVPDDLTVHVLDGRYCDFSGDTNLTPGVEEFCQSRKGVRYHAPPEDRLPFGNPDKSAYRSSVHEKCRWAYYEVLPQDEWTLHLDTDEQLVWFDRSVLEEVQDDVAYRPLIYTREIENSRWKKTGRLLFTPRLFKPEHWTFWVDDLLIPRSYLSRDVRDLQRIKEAYQSGYRESFERTRKIAIFNVGSWRSNEYLDRRADQLERFNRTKRANRVRDL